MGYSLEKKGERVPPAALRLLFAQACHLLLYHRKPDNDSFFQIFVFIFKTPLKNSKQKIASRITFYRFLHCIQSSLPK